MGAYNADMRAHRALLSKDMEYAAWTEVPFWSQYMGFIGNEDQKFPRSVALGSNEKRRRLKATGMPIEVLTDFQNDGGYTMDIPLINPLTERPIYGDNQVLGTEESKKITYKSATINQVRKGAVVRTGAMSEQYLKKPEVQKELMSNTKALLQDFNVRFMGFQPYNAAFRRYSENVYATTANGGLGKTQASHPNFYAAGYGKATWSDTPATYEANVATALTSLTNTAADLFSTAVIENAVALASRLKIQPLKATGRYAMVINPDQMLQLIRDSNWLLANQNAAPRDYKANKLFNGEYAGTYRGCDIFVDQNNPDAKLNGDTGFVAAQATTLSTAGTQYGNTNPYSDPLATGDRKLALLFGQSFIACGYASPLKFESETWDYKNKKTEASNMIVGFERADIYDYDGYFGTANLFRENTSSLVIATYSPFSLAWT